MIPIISLLVVLSLSILITRIAAVALTHTGLSRDAARFQARSAFTGVGFTTAESEKVVNHPIRRRILMLLMLVGNAGIVTSVSTLILAFIDMDENRAPFWPVVLLVGGLVFLWAVASSRWVDRRLNVIISRMLKRYTRLELRDYANMLHLSGEYRVAELAVAKEDWIAGKTLEEGGLREEGVLVLGIQRPDGTYLGTPEGETEIRVDDILIAYGRAASFEALDRRRSGRRGDREHRKAVREQEKIAEKEMEADPAAE